MDKSTPKFQDNSEYFENFPSPDISSPDHLGNTTANSDTNSLDWNVSSPLHNQSDFSNSIPSELLVFVERLQQEVHSLDRKCREYQLYAEESKLEMRNMELELELNKQELNREREERKKEFSLATDYRIELEEKLATTQGEVVQLEKKLVNIKKRDEKYKERIHSLQKSLIEFQEQIKELDVKVCEGDKCVNQLTTEREQLIVDLEEATNNAECLANQNQELELEVTWHKDELIDTRESLNHLQKQFEFESLKQTVQSCADEVSLLEEIGQDGIFGGPIHLQTDQESADEQTDIPEYMTPQMLPPAKPTGFIDAPKLEYLEQEVGRVSTLEETIASLMEQLDIANSECDDLHSELFTSRAQVKLKEKECVEMRDKLLELDTDRDRMRNKINKARVKLSKVANEKQMLEERCSCYSNSLEEKREENLSLERQLISLIEQKIVLSEEIAAYEIDVSCLLKSNINKKLQTEEHKPRKIKWFS
ncbi:hypothetical protein LOD99_6008 [Oopsacas minuta]|uniref:Uncharacterized protein n=1 Tax=Oopsacas minuta TaxID=111878 RepID=A0AAV7JNE4_9METZ|nr:hypothetical protein LOD99_6008 [Oopsacas minuta]